MPAPNLTPSGSGREDLHVLMTCPMCQDFQPLCTPRILAQQGESHLLFLECRQCGSSVVAFVSTDPTDIGPIGMITDLTSEELMGSMSIPAVTPDQVIDVHQWLSTHNSIHLTLRREKV